MAQFARPDNDDIIGNYIDELGGNTNIFQSIDESSFDDSDYVNSGTVGAGVEDYNAGASVITDPVSSVNHTVRWRYRKDQSGGRAIEAILQIRQAGVIIVTRNFLDISTLFTQDTYTFSAAEADSITDYSNLNFRLIGKRSGTGGGRELHVSWIELEVPNAGAGPSTKFINMSEGEEIG